MVNRNVNWRANQFIIAGGVSQLFICYRAYLFIDFLMKIIIEWNEFRQIIFSLTLVECPAIMNQSGCRHRVVYTVFAQIFKFKKLVYIKSLEAKKCEFDIELYRS